MNVIEFVKDFKELYKSYKFADSAMPISGVASSFYHLEVDVRFHLGILALLEKHGLITIQDSSGSKKE